MKYPRLTVLHQIISTLLALGVLLAAGGTVVSCGQDEPEPLPEAADRTAPKVSVLLTDVNVFGGKTVTLEVGKLSIGGTEAATWTDDKSVADKLKAEVKFNGKAINSGTALSESGTLTVTVTDEAGNG